MDDPLHQKCNGKLSDKLFSPGHYLVAACRFDVANNNNRGFLAGLNFDHFLC